MIGRIEFGKSGLAHLALNMYVKLLILIVLVERKPRPTEKKSVKISARVFLEKTKYFTNALYTHTRNRHRINNSPKMSAKKRFQPFGTEMRRKLEFSKDSTSLEHGLPFEIALFFFSKVAEE